MKYDRDRANNRSPQRRRSIRLQGYDYSRAGAYFLTICVQGRECIFGEIVDGEMVLNEYGKIVRDEWIKTGEIRNEIELDEWVVMPNHFHAIVMIPRGDRPVAPTTATVAPATMALPGSRPQSIGSLMSGFKSAVTKRINELRNHPGMKLWQRNYYDHIIRNENELNRIRQYIINNPLNWEIDENYAVL